MDGKTNLIKESLTLLFLILTPLGLIICLFELASVVNTFGVYVLASGLSCLVAIGAIELYERSK